MKKIVSFRCPIPLWHRVKVAAQRLGLSVQELCRAAIEAYLRTHGG